MAKIVFIGAGSLTFTRELVKDILTFPLLEDATLVLMDINRERLGFAGQAVERIVREGKYPAKIIATPNRQAALSGANAVVCTIRGDALKVWQYDIILCRAMQKSAKVKVTGLCHSVQGTARMLARWIGAPMEEITYVCAGINHQAWYIKFERNHKDAYPFLRKALRRPEIRNAELVRNEMFRQFGYYVTESSGHNSEYNWWFRKRPDLIEKYCTHGSNWNPGLHAYNLNSACRAQTTWKDDIKKWLNNPEPLNLKRGHEYAASIINAYLGGEIFRFNGNVPNTGIIPNLPQNACVEVPVFADRRGFNPVYVGPLPPQCAAHRYLVCSMQGYFPVLVKMGARSLAVIFRTGGTHIAASATLAVATSADGGKCWSDPVEITPRWEDSRNPAFGGNARDELIAAFWKAGMNCYVEDENGQHWKRMPPNGNIPSMFVCVSKDSGRTWSQPIPYLSTLLKRASPYGRIIQAPDGTLLMGIYGTPRKSIEGENYISVLVRSHDGGYTWDNETLEAEGHNETSYTFLAGGRLLAAARSNNSAHVATLFSDDGGRTWSQPKQITRNGEHPADLTVLADGKVLMTFGRRVRPMGCGALLSRDGGQTWDINHEVLLAGDGVENGDLGYPSTVQLDDGTIITALYYASASEMSGDYKGWGDVSW
jgi:alpha-galactosidase